MKKKNDKTNWDLYYKKNPPKIILKGRKIHEDLLVNTLGEREFKSALEFGGANSKIAERFSSEYQIRRFLIVDNNKYGLELTKKNVKIENLETKLSNIFSLNITKKFDLVYSIGLIEHFNIKGTKKAILKHIEATKKGGYILLSFPTPTLQYKLVRFLLELIGLWEFADERPLKIDEVLKTLKKFSSIEKVRINRKLLATQAIVLAKKN